MDKLKIQRFLSEGINQISLAVDWLSANKEAADEVDRKNLGGVISEQKMTGHQMKTLDPQKPTEQSDVAKLSGSATLKLLVIISIPRIIFAAATLTFTARRFPFLSLNCCHHRVSLFRAREEKLS